MRNRYSIIFFLLLIILSFINCNQKNESTYTKSQDIEATSKQKSLNLSFHAFSQSWTNRHINTLDSLKKQSIDCSFETQLMKDKNIEIIIQECKDLKKEIVLKIETFKKQYDLKYVTTLQVVSVQNDIQYYIDTIESDWLVDRNQLIVDSLIFNKSKNAKLCGTALISLENKDFPTSNEKRISKEDTQQLLTDWGIK